LFLAFLCTEKRVTVEAGRERSFMKKFMKNSGLRNTENIDFSRLWTYNNT